MSSPYYYQVIQDICERIARKELVEEQALPSIRKLASDYQLSPNTVQRSMWQLQQMGIVQAARGTGYFVAQGAREKVREDLQKEFWGSEAPAFCYKMAVLEVSIEQFVAFQQQYKNQKGQELKGS